MRLPRGLTALLMFAALAAPVRAQPAMPSLDAAYGELHAKVAAFKSSAAADRRRSEKLLKLVTVADDGNGGAALVRSSLRVLASCPTGKRLLARLADEDVPAALSFADLGSGVTYSGAGFVGTYAETDPRPSTMTVRINTRFLAGGRTAGMTDARLARALAGPLAHELLGHVLEGTLARRRGLSRAFRLYRGNERNANLTGWLVEAELGEPEDALTDDYLRDKDAFDAKMAERRTDYALNLPLSDLAGDPRAAYVARRRVLRDAADRERGALDDAAFYARMADHFYVAHVPGDPLYRGLDALAGVRGLAAANLQWQQGLAAALKSSDVALGRELTRLDEPDYASSLAADAGEPSFAAWERQIAEKEAELARLIRAAPRAKSKPAPRPAGQITADDLVRLYDADRAAHPDHWR